MNKFFTILICVFSFNCIVGQGNSLVINGAYLKLNNGTIANPIYLVVNQSNTSAITVPGGGHIISESEYNYVKLNIGSSTGSYCIPFGYSTTDYLPLTINKTTNGSPASGSFTCSTYSTGSNNLPWSEGVTTMQCAPGFGELFVLDRWWTIDASSYSTTKPDVDLTFKYRDPIEYSLPNSITEGSLKVQQWDSDANNWKIPTGLQTGNEVTTSVSGVDLYRNWVLTDVVISLPIELISFETTCNETNITLEWITATETNNDFFTLEKTKDGQNFEIITQIDGSGSSTEVHHYSYMDESSTENDYYQLRQTDFDGHSTVSNLIASKKCKSDDLNIDIYPNPSSGIFFYTYKHEMNNFISVQVMDLLGNIIYESNEEKGEIDLVNRAEGVYFLQINRSGKMLNQKIVIER